MVGIFGGKAEMDPLLDPTLELLQSGQYQSSSAVTLATMIFVPSAFSARGHANLSGRNVMSEPRFTALTPETMTADQKRAADAIQSGLRGAGLRGPFNALLRSAEL